MIPTYGFRCKYKSIDLTGGSIADAFTISGGPVFCVLMAMELTTLQDQPCTMAWQSDPTLDGGASGPTPIAAAYDMNALETGDWVFAEGDATELVPRAIGVRLAQGIGGDTTGYILPVGGIDIIMADNSPTTGAGMMYIIYMPMTPNAVISG